MNRKFLVALSLVGCFSSIISLSLIYIGDLNLHGSIRAEFQDPNDDLLIGTYYQGSLDAGIIVLEGFGSDQIAIKGIASEFNEIGFHVFTFDFSGHGQSPGALGFDNAATDRLAYQVIAAKEEFKSLSGLEDDRILLIGHSMGARVALQSTLIDSNYVAGVILLGGQINLAANVQSSFFTGVQDTDLDWVQSLSHSNPPVDILMISGTWDDIITPSAAQLLYENLGGSTSRHGRELVIIDNLFHNYVIYSPQAISKALNWGVEILDLEDNPTHFASKTLLRNVFWLIAIITLFLFTISSFMALKKQDGEPDEKIELKITDQKRFLVRKLILWIASLPILLIMFIIFMLIPLGVPVFNLIYVGFIGGYGILLLILYRKGKVTGVSGTLEIHLKPDMNNLNINTLFGLLSAFLLITLGVLFANSGIYYVFPLNERIIWLALFTILTIPGFYISRKELIMVKNSKGLSKNISIILMIIGLIPFLLFAVLFFAIGSTSGMIGAVHGLIILGFVITGGELVYSIGKSLTLTIIFQSFLIQFLVLPQGVLFKIF